MKTKLLQIALALRLLALVKCIKKKFFKKKPSQDRLAVYFCV